VRVQKQRGERALDLTERLVAGCIIVSIRPFPARAEGGKNG